MTSDPSSGHGANRGQFRKGQSGNPGGRPAKSVTPAPSAFAVVVEKTLTITRNGIPREVTMEEALQHRTYQEAIAGKRLAQKEVIRWIEKREAWREKNAPKDLNRKVKFVHSSEPDNADSALVLLGIAAHDPRRAGLDKERAQLLLEPWAVQAGLDRRRRMAPLVNEEVNDIRRCTRDPGSLRWPREALR